ncbi:MAG: acyl-ACP--UDP-N-acetylglucosamine O-acyltransferase [Stenomitos rutilans HA7619-LM2]|nr:acyl-ACP--UDP-N-acetylglucosamine O-acyltransferase [Stenomitos rutilans HA7619-LM2]
MTTLLHPTATIHPHAELHPTVQVGAHAVIGAKVKIGPETIIGPNVVLDGWTEIGARNQIFPGAAIGVEPQDPSTTSAHSLVKIGDDNQIREYVTISRSNHADEVTSIGDRNLLMAYIHMAQGCMIENQVVIANAVILGEHVHVESRAFISGIGEIHPFVHVGRLVMVAFMHQITRDIPPYMLVEGQPARVRSLNRVGLKRAGLASEKEGQVIQTLRTAFRLLYRSGFSLEQSLEKIDSLPDNEHLLHLQQFLRRSQVEGRRGLTPGKNLGRLEAATDDTVQLY